MILLVANSLANAQQISDGVRVMMGAPGLNDEQHNKINPAIHPFIILSQPIVESVIPPNSMQKFKRPTDVLQFFSKLPPSIRRNGLWVTWMKNIPLNESDNGQITAMVKEATGMDFPIFTCQPRKATKNTNTWLVAWECNMAFPQKGMPFICEPSDQAKTPGPPLWNCTNDLTQ